MHKTIPVSNELQLEPQAITAEYVFVYAEHSEGHVEKIIDGLRDSDVIACEYVGFASEEQQMAASNLLSAGWAKDATEETKKDIWVQLHDENSLLRQLYGEFEDSGKRFEFWI